MRDGAGVYRYPPGTEGVPDTTIESAKYNGYIADVQQDLNLPRPIGSGGTGSNTVTGALFNLGAEGAAQLVSNYDSQVWVPGSFRSVAGATNAPVAGHSFAGIAYINEPLANPPINLNVVIEARDENDTTVPGRVYAREKKSGTWGAWTLLPGSTTGQYVLLAGDTMTGGLGQNALNPQLSLNRTNNTGVCQMYVLEAGITRWLWRFADNGAAANFALYNYNDAGANIGAPLTINRLTGMTNIGSSLTVTGTITGSGTITGGNISTTGTVTGGAISTAGTVTAGTVTAGTVTATTINSTTIVSSGSITSPSAIVSGTGLQVTTGGAVTNGITLASPNTLNLVSNGNIWFRGDNGGGLGRANAFMAEFIIYPPQNGLCFRGSGNSGTVTHIDFCSQSLTQCGGINVDQGAHTTVYQTTSDIRGKPNREPISPAAARAVIDALQVWDFDKEGNAIRGYGVIAQQAYEVHQSLAHKPEKEDAMWMTEKAAPVPFLIAALQGANRTIDKLEERLAALELKLAGK